MRDAGNRTKNVWRLSMHTDRARIDYLKTEIEIGIALARIALRSEDAKKTDRNRALALLITELRSKVVSPAVKTRMRRSELSATSKLAPSETSAAGRSIVSAPGKSLKVPRTASAG
jgi:hypothetical protein